MGVKALSGDEREVLVIALYAALGGWFLVDLNKSEAVQGPYTKHEDAVAAAETRAHRIAQGWKP